MQELIGLINIEMTTPCVLALCAHPDDAELQCGGTLLRLAHLGWTVHIGTLSAGDCGSIETAPAVIATRRMAEATAAATRLRGTYHCLGGRDLQLSDNQILRTAHARAGSGPWGALLSASPWQVWICSSISCPPTCSPTSTASTWSPSSGPSPAPLSCLVDYTTPESHLPTSSSLSQRWPCSPCATFCSWSPTPARRLNSIYQGRNMASVWYTTSCAIREPATLSRAMPLIQGGRVHSVHDAPLVGQPTVDRWGASSRC